MLLLLLRYRCCYDSAEDAAAGCWCNCRSGPPTRLCHTPPPPLPAPPLAVLWNGNPLLPQQWAAVALVFSGLFLSSWMKSRRARHAKHAADLKAQ